MANEGLRIRISVDREACAGAGNCVRTLGEIFDQDEADGLVVLLHDTASPEMAAALKRAVQLCPVSAISVSIEE